MSLKALAPDLKLTSAQQRDTDPGRGLNQVDQLFALDNGTVICALGACPQGVDTRVFWLDPQSKVVYRALEHRGIETGLVVYPGEGHGFRQPEHQRDCAQRMLVWFEEYLPV